jgi:hypothetical protein
VSEHALWWPPAKIAGRYLAPYLALHHEEMEVPGRKGDVAVDLELGVKSPNAGRSAGERSSLRKCVSA